MQAEIDPAEELANFIVESSKIKATGVDHRAFLPGGDGERSVFRIGGLCQEYIAAYGQAFVGNARDKKILGWATVQAAAVSGLVPLRLRADEPPPRHAVIDQWPTEPQQKRLLAMELAKAATCVRYP